MEQVKNMYSPYNKTFTIHVKADIVGYQLSSYLFIIFVIALFVSVIVDGFALQIVSRIADLEKHIGASQSQKPTSLLPIKENIV